jgi:hypothetical protein
MHFILYFASYITSHALALGFQIGPLNNQHKSAQVIVTLRFFLIVCQVCSADFQYHFTMG